MVAMQTQLPCWLTRLPKTLRCDAEVTDCAESLKESLKERAMADLDDIYSSRILELAAAIPRSERLTNPHATAEAQSKLCGSTIEVDLTVDDGVITNFGQTVKACLLGQAAASVVGREIVGTPIHEFRALRDIVRDMLKNDGPTPDGRWQDLATLKPVKDYPHRHASTLLVFDAVLLALDNLDKVGPIGDTARSAGDVKAAGAV